MNPKSPLTKYPINTKTTTDNPKKISLALLFIGSSVFLNYSQRFACMCSSGLKALTCPFCTMCLRSTDLRFTTLPAIATYTLLGHRAFSFSSHSVNRLRSPCLSVLVIFFVLLLICAWGIFENCFSRLDRHTLWLALVCGQL